MSENEQIMSENEQTTSQKRFTHIKPSKDSTVNHILDSIGNDLQKNTKKQMVNMSVSLALEDREYLRKYCFLKNISFSDIMRKTIEQLKQDEPLEGYEITLPPSMYKAGRKLFKFPKG